MNTQVHMHARTHTRMHHAYTGKKKTILAWTSVHLQSHSCAGPEIVHLMMDIDPTLLCPGPCEPGQGCSQLPEMTRSTGSIQAKLKSYHPLLQLRRPWRGAHEARAEPASQVASASLWMPCTWADHAWTIPLLSPTA